MHIDTDGKPPDVLCHKAASETRGGEHHDQGAFRYAAYLARVKSLVSMKAAGAARYLAFTSDVGEAARPLVPPAVVHASYGIAGAYMIGDVAYHGYRARQEGRDVRRAVAQTSVFQLLASFAIPLAVIHTAVNRSQRLFKQLGRYTKYGPSVVGLSFVPVLPYAIDEPIEHGIQKLFDAVWPEQQTAAAPADDTRKDKDNAE